jgi:hypothetical protein
MIDRIGSSDIILKVENRKIQHNFGSDWSNGFREDFEKVYD